MLIWAENSLPVVPGRVVAEVGQGDDLVAIEADPGRGLGAQERDQARGDDDLVQRHRGRHQLEEHLGDVPGGDGYRAELLYHEARPPGDEGVVAGGHVREQESSAGGGLRLDAGSLDQDLDTREGPAVTALARRAADAAGPGGVRLRPPPRHHQLAPGSGPRLQTVRREELIQRLAQRSAGGLGLDPHLGPHHLGGEEEVEAARDEVEERFGQGEAFVPRLDLRKRRPLSKRRSSPQEDAEDQPRHDVSRNLGPLGLRRSAP